MAAASKSADNAEAAVAMRWKPAARAAAASRSLLTTAVAAHSRVHAAGGSNCSNPGAVPGFNGGVVTTTNGSGIILCQTSGSAPPLGSYSQCYDVTN